MSNKRKYTWKWLVLSWGNANKTGQSQVSKPSYSEVSSSGAYANWQSGRRKETGKTCQAATANKLDHNAKQEVMEFSAAVKLGIFAKKTARIMFTAKPKKLVNGE